MPKGTIIGLTNVFYALLVTDPVSGAATYEAPVHIPGAISAKINPNASVDTLFADDGPYDVASTLGKISLDLNVADLDLDTQAALLGHTIVGGVLQRLSSDVPPWVAIGFKTLKSNGSYRYTWLNKGKFMVQQQDYQTRAASVAFVTPTINGMFVKRDCDNEWERHIDEDYINYVPSQGTNWFNTPYGGATDTVAPTLSSIVPAANANAVVVTGATIVMTFSEALALSTVVNGNFTVFQDVAGTLVLGTLSINTARTIVTFTPNAPLAAATVYRIVISADVKDVAGNTFAGLVSKFTTA